MQNAECKVQNAECRMQRDHSRERDVARTRSFGILHSALRWAALLRLLCSPSMAPAPPMATGRCTAATTPARAIRRSPRSTATMLRSCRRPGPVSYTHLRAHETPEHLVCRLLLEK